MITIYNDRKRKACWTCEGFSEGEKTPKKQKTTDEDDDAGRQTPDEDDNNTKYQPYKNTRR